MLETDWGLSHFGGTLVQTTFPSMLSASWVLFFCTSALDKFQQTLWHAHTPSDTTVSDASCLANVCVGGSGQRLCW